jgi:uncharacterized protein (TIGR03435 family)
MTRGQVFLLLFTLSGQISAQLLHPVATMPSYSVVSIRPSDPSEEQMHGEITQDRYRADRTTVRDLIAYAFGLGYEQEVANAPAWVLNQRFDVQAKLDDAQVAASRMMDRDHREEQTRLMMQSMLAERFHLTYHFEIRSLPVYELQIAKGGLKCPEDTVSPPAIPDMTRPRFSWYNAPAPPPPSRDARPQAQPSDTLRTRGWPFWLVVSWITHQPELEGRPVIDKTGLDSSYDCQMTWVHGPSDETGQFFFPALQGQLGLKLQPTKGPVEVLVIDTIQLPTEN